MSNKDYIVIAQALSNARAVEGVDESTLDVAVAFIGAALQADNPRFDPKKFYAAATW